MQRVWDISKLHQAGIQAQHPRTAVPRTPATGCFGNGEVTLFNSVKSSMEFRSVINDAPESGSYFSVLQVISFCFNLLGKQIVLSACPSPVADRLSRCLRCQLHCVAN